MKQFEYVPEIKSELGDLTKAELRRYVLDYYKQNLKGKRGDNRLFEFQRALQARWKDGKRQNSRSVSTKREVLLQY